MLAQTDSPTHNELPTWEEALVEGERRIKQRLLDALILTPARDRARLLTQRETVKRKMQEALQKRDTLSWRRAWKEQVKLLQRVSAQKENPARATSVSADLHH